MLMNNISTKAALFLFDAKSKFGKAKDYLGRKAKSIVKEENGDTNFTLSLLFLQSFFWLLLHLWYLRTRLLDGSMALHKLSLIRQVSQKVILEAV